MRQPPDILYVSYDGLLDPVGSSQVVPYLERLGRRGFSIDVLSFEKRAAEDAQVLEAMGDRLGEAGVRWTRCRYHARPSLPATAWDIWTGRRIVARRARAHPGLLLHARSVVAGLMSLPAKKRMGARLLYDARGFWTAERVESGRWSASSPVTRWARSAESTLHRDADAVVHLSRAAMAGVRRLVPEEPRPPVEVVPTCTDLDRFALPSDAAEISRLRSRLRLGDGPIAVHSGTLTGWYRSADTLRTLARFVEITDGTALLLTQQVDEARSLAREAGADVLIRSAAPVDVPRYLRACDVGLALVRPTFAKTASAPIKVGEYLACGLGVVTSAGVGDLKEQLAGSPIALAASGDMGPDELARFMAAAVDYPDRGCLARALAERHYSLGAGVDSYARIYRGLGVDPR